MFISTHKYYIGIGYNDRKTKSQKNEKYINLLNKSNEFINFNLIILIKNILVISNSLKYNLKLKGSTEISLSKKI